jgi:hypothetical protein
MLLRSLNISPKFHMNVLVVVQVLSSEKVSEGESVWHAINVKKCIQPEHGIAYKWDALECEQVVTAACMILDCINLVFDLRDVFILGTEVGIDYSKHVLWWLNLWISIDDGYWKASLTIDLDHLVEVSYQRWDLMVQ